MEDHEKVIRTNLLGTMYGSYVALEQFYKQGSGTLINVGSFAGMMGAPLMGSYAASKFGIRGLDMALRQEAKQAGFENVHVCTVAPVSMDTPFFQHQANYSGKPVHPYGKVYDPKKVIDVIVRLAKEPEDEVIVGSSGKMARAIQRMSPKLLENVYGKRSYSQHYKQSGSAPRRSGAVEHPVKYGDEVYGGWMAKQRKKSAGKMLIGIAIPAVLGYLAWQRVRPKGEVEIDRAA
jgi:short-subunit dehydrogenase